MSTNSVIEIKRNKALKLLFSLIIISLFFSPALSQTQKDNILKIFGKCDSKLEALKDGSISVDNSKKNLLKLNLPNIKLIGKKTGTEAKFQDITASAINLKDATSSWTLDAPADNKSITMKKEKVTITIAYGQDNSKLTFLINNENDFADKDFAEAKMKFHFDYKSHLPFNYKSEDSDGNSHYLNLFEDFYFKKAAKEISNFSDTAFETDNPQFFYDAGGKEKFKAEEYKNGVYGEGEQEVEVNVSPLGEFFFEKKKKTAGENYPLRFDVTFEKVFDINGEDFVRNYDFMDRSTKPKPFNFDTYFFLQRQTSLKMQVFPNQPDDAKVKSDFIQTITAYEQTLPDAQDPSTYVYIKGDKTVSFEIKNFPFCTKDDNKCTSFGDSKFLEFALKINFPDQDYVGDFNLNSVAKSDDENFKIVSWSLNNNTSEKRAKANQENMIILRTTAFTGTANLSLKFDFKVVVEEEGGSTAIIIILVIVAVIIIAGALFMFWRKKNNENNKTELL